MTSAQRSPTIPNLPTVAESGLSGYEAMPWLGILAPAGTPPNIINRLNQEVLSVLNLPEIREQFKLMGLDIAGNTPTEFAAFISLDQKKWAQVIKDSGATVD